MVVRAGDMIQVGDNLRLALTVARIALALAARSGAPADEIGRLQRMLLALESR